MVDQKWLPISCQLTDPYYLQVYVYICDKIAENQSRSTGKTSINMIFLYSRSFKYDDQHKRIFFDVNGIVQLESV